MNWQPLLNQARLSFADVERFDEDERTYKLAIAAAVLRMLEAARDGSEWSPTVSSVFNRSHASYPYNISRYTQHDWLRKLDADGIAAGRQTFGAMLEEDDPFERFDRFASFAEEHADSQGRTPGAVLVVGSVLNFGIDPYSLPPLKTRALTTAENVVGWEPPKGLATELYARHLEFVRALEETLRVDGVPVRDTLDAQSVIWEWWLRNNGTKGAEPEQSPSVQVQFSEDELVLLLDFYLRQRAGDEPSLNQLRQTVRSLEANRSRRRDPSFRTSDGLRSGAGRFGAFEDPPTRKLDGPRPLYKKVWERYANKPEDLGVRAAELRASTRNQYERRRASGREAWIRDEIVLLLAFYRRQGSEAPASALEELSKTLRGLPVERWLAEDPEFRSPEEIKAKLREVDAIISQQALPKTADPALLEVVADFSEADELDELAGAIAGNGHGTDAGDDESMVDFVEEAPEGRVLTRRHVVRERSRKLVDSKKRSVLQATGSLRCEACDFDFSAAYGDRGTGFIECHHTRPVSEMGPDGTTHLDDLALVCSNCHRMIHRSVPWLSVEDLRALVLERSSQ